MMWETSGSLIFPIANHSLRSGSRSSCVFDDVGNLRQSCFPYCKPFFTIRALILMRFLVRLSLGTEPNNCTVFPAVLWPDPDP
jgi:hypothetical protein